MGVSDTIIGYLKEYCAEHGIGSLRVDTHHGNYPMIRMLERAGYDQIVLSYKATDVRTMIEACRLALFISATASIVWHTSFR